MQMGYLNNEMICAKSIGWDVSLHQAGRSHAILPNSRQRRMKRTNEAWVKRTVKGMIGTIRNTDQILISGLLIIPAYRGMLLQMARYLYIRFPGYATQKSHVETGHMKKKMGQEQAAGS